MRRLPKPPTSLLPTLPGSLRAPLCRFAQISVARTIALLGFLWMTSGAETIAIFAQTDVASSTIEGKVTDQFDDPVSGNAGSGENFYCVDLKFEF